jgi:hypothetical protein
LDISKNTIEKKYNNSGKEMETEAIIGNRALSVTGNVNGKDKYFKALDFKVEFDDKNIVQLDKSIKVGSYLWGASYFCPTVKVKLPANTATGRYNCKFIITNVK